MLWQQADYGENLFCENKVPCVIFSIEGCAVTPQNCNALLKDKRPDLYQLYYSADGTGGCGLDPASKMNWITRYGFNQE